MDGAYHINQGEKIKYLHGLLGQTQEFIGRLIRLDHLLSVYL